MQDSGPSLREEEESEILVRRSDRVMTIILNRPHEINALTTGMVRLIRQALDEARQQGRFQFVLLLGAGGRGFCSGGDVKRLAKALREKAYSLAEQFFDEEYALDLYLHRFPKPVVVIADGITMGGGLGLAAGADIVVVTEQTVMAMPETRIGFFPDVGATGWLFTKCPAGYPEYLGLTGHEVKGVECIRLGLANCFARKSRLEELRKALVHYPEKVSPEKMSGVRQVKAFIRPFLETGNSSDPEMDAWVARYFAGKDSVREIMTTLSQCRKEMTLCEDAYRRMAMHSPTALALTLKLLRHNQGRSLERVLAAEAKAARFIIRHPDYAEGIRAHILDKDGTPHWQPSAIMETLCLDSDLEP